MSVRKKGIEKQIFRARTAGALDGVVRTETGLSWGRARELVRRGKVAVEGCTETDPLFRVREGALIALDPEARDPRALAAALPEDAIVFCDAHVVVVDKPSGVATMPFDPAGMRASIARRPRAGEPPALDERVRGVLAKREKLRGPPQALGIVHRLDKETSGLIVFTRTWEAKRALLQAFRFHHVHRRYLALVHGRAEPRTIESHFVEDRGDGLRGSVERRRGRAYVLPKEKAQRAVTHVEVLERFERAGVTLVACRLQTGRTHQIRIHLSEAGHPLLGERVYVRGYQGPIFPAPRVMLHAAELGFVHPHGDREMRWSSEPPPDFQELLDALRRTG